MSSKPTKTAATAGFRRGFRAFNIELDTISKGVFTVARSSCLFNNNCRTLGFFFEPSLFDDKKEEHLTRLSLAEEVVLRNLAVNFVGWKGGDDNRIG